MPNELSSGAGGITPCALAPGFGVRLDVVLWLDVAFWVLLPTLELVEELGPLTRDRAVELGTDLPDCWFDTVAFLAVILLRPFELGGGPGGGAGTAANGPTA